MRSILPSRSVAGCLKCMLLCTSIVALADGADAPQRVRRVLYNFDGDSCLSTKAHSKGPVAVVADDVKRLIEEVAYDGSRVDTVLVCINAQVMYYPTKVGTLRGTLSSPEERLKWPASEKQRFENLKAFFDAGVDPYAIMLAETKRRGREALLTFRMNDDHGDDFLRTQFLVDHPDWRLGTERYRGMGAMDFGRDEVRDYTFGLIEEAVRRYDCDGIELDFNRFPTFFKSETTDERVAKMNSLVERVRKMLDDVGRERNRRLVLGVRVPSNYGRTPPTPDTSRQLGCDVPAWAKHGWIDFVAVSEFLFERGDLPLDQWKKVITTVPVYGGIECTRGGGRKNLTAQEYRQAAQQLQKAGADGTYLFNFFTSREGGVAAYEPPFEVLKDLEPSVGATQKNGGLSRPEVAGGSKEISVEKRPAWTTSRMTGSPEPPPPYITEQVFPSLKFNQCLDLVAIPGSKRLMVVEQSGKVFSFPNQPDVAMADLVVDFAKSISGVKQVYSLAFHPNFQQNRYCYVCYIKAANDPEGTHVARFRMTDADPPAIDVATETTMLTWQSGGHNGCCLKFGPDGCLYVSTGDAAPANPPDTMKTGQDLKDLLSSILRIDVDHSDEGRNYRIPADNPFVSLQGARSEVWAYGLRNPWRMSFDRKTGDLWVGDVGWELWEMLYRVERGGNYGWAVMEGQQSTNPEWPRGPTPILPPTIEHPHTESSSITDGLTYYGSRLKDLHGTHIYGDYDTGKFWGFRYENGDVVDHRELADTTHRVVSFGEDHQGEFLILDHVAGTIHRLVPNPHPDRSQTFPRKISEIGVFASVAEQTPAAGVMPYSINAELWSDYADAERFVAVPNELSIKAEGANWTFPKDSVLVKTLSLEMRRGDPASRRRIETQILHYDGIDWMPYTYQWNDEQTDASLVGATGAERTFEIEDAEATDGKCVQTWRFSGRAECQRCHNKWSGPALAFNTPQLNKVHGSSGTLIPQIDVFSQIGLFEKPVGSENRPKLSNPRDESADLENRARAYLQVNCAHCHRMHAGGSVLSLMHYDVALDKTNMIGVRPSQGTFGIYAAQVIAPRDPFRSIMLYRMAKLGGGRMPHIGSMEVDREGVELVSRWIAKMPAASGIDANGHESAATQRTAETAAWARLRESNTLAEQSELIEQLLSTPSGALRLLRSVDHHELPEAIASRAVEAAVKHGDVSIRDLFERFLPAEQRVKRLGSVVRPEQILSLSGDAARGKTVFFETASVSCKNCHRIQQDGKEIGPDLTTIGKKLTQGQLLESILQPSKSIDPKYVTHLVETKDGQILTGILVDKRNDHVVLRDAQDKQIQIPNNSLEQLVPQRQSLMPDLLVRDLTAQQVADLLAYLSSLK